MMETYQSDRASDRMRSRAPGPGPFGAACRRSQWRTATGVAARLAALLLIGGPALAVAPVEAAQSLWSNSDVPATLADSDTAAVELGVKFSSSVAGSVTGVRFYKGPSNRGTHTGSLWTASGTRLARGTFVNETASGWQTLMFAAPVVIAANTTYVASYYAPQGRYAFTNGYFASARTNGVLTAPANGGAGNGVYRYGRSGFPRQSYQASNYWIDVLVEAGSTAPPPPPPPAPAPVATGGPPAGYTLAWSDEFNSLSLGGPASGKNWAPYFTGWNVRYLAGNSDDAVKAGDYEQLVNGRSTAGDALSQTGLWGSRSGYLHEIMGGQLALRGYPVPSGQQSAFWGKPYVASMISGQPSFSQRYGYWEVRLRLTNVSQGHHFAVWLMPTDNSWPPEIDMLEVVGLDPSKYHMTSHGSSNDQLVWFHPSDPTGWHTLGFLWTPDRMTWYLDGEAKKSIANYVTNKNFYFMMSWEMASNWPGNPDGTTRWPAEVAVDYVRIYKPAS